LFFALVVRSGKRFSLIQTLAILQITFVIALIAFVAFGYQLQVSIALPYIRDSIERQCGIDNPLVTSDGFTIDSGYRWQSETNEITCFFNNQEWICEC
jgi:hypothetical protein